MGDNKEENYARMIDETLESEFDVMESANKVLSKAELARREDAQRKKQVEMAKVRVQLNILKNDLEEAIQNQDFVKAQLIKLEMDKLDVEQNKLQDELTEAAAMAPVPSSGARQTKTKQTGESISKKRKSLEPQQGGMDVEDGDEEQLNASVNVKCDDPFIIHKSLKMLGVMLESNDIKSMNATLQSLLDEFVVPSVQNVDFQIRNSAVKAMGK